MMIPKEQFVELVAKNVDPVESLGNSGNNSGGSAIGSRANSSSAAAATAGGGGGGGGGFTDSDISTGAAGAGRELVAWQPDSDSSADQHRLSLDTPDDGEWDQFAVNEIKFGVTSTWSEDHYTTPIDKSHADYRRIEREAQRLAAQIEREARTAVTTNVHLLEERGEDVSHIDEEARYGAVVRDAADELPTLSASNDHDSSTTAASNNNNNTTAATTTATTTAAAAASSATSSKSSRDRSKDGSKDRPQKESSKGDKKSRPPLTNEVRDYNAINALNLEPSSKAFERARLARLQQIQQQTTPLVKKQNAFDSY